MKCIYSMRSCAAIAGCDFYGLTKLVYQLKLQFLAQQENKQWRCIQNLISASRTKILILKGNYWITDNRKLGIKVDESSWESEKLSRWKTHIKEHIIIIIIIIIIISSRNPCHSSWSQPSHHPPVPYSKHFSISSGK